MRTKKILLAAVIVLGVSLSSCTQRTCPTYAKQDIKIEKSSGDTKAKV